MSLSPEAQHVIDSLEAHVAAVAKAAQTATPEVLDAVEKFGEDALVALGEFVDSLRGKAAAVVAAAEAAKSGGADSLGSEAAAGLSGDATGSGADGAGVGGVVGS